MNLYRDRIEHRLCDRRTVLTPREQSTKAAPRGHNHTLPSSLTSSVFLACNARQETTPSLTEGKSHRSNGRSTLASTERFDISYTPPCRGRPATIKNKGAPDTPAPSTENSQPAAAAPQRRLQNQPDEGGRPRPSGDAKQASPGPARPSEDQRALRRGVGSVAQGALQHKPPLSMDSGTTTKMTRTTRTTRTTTRRVAPAVRRPSRRT